MSDILSPKMWTVLTTVSLFSVCVEAASTGMGTCGSRRYQNDGICCNMCEPGYKVEQDCTSQPDDGVCMPCSEGYYQNDWSGATFCHPINKCNKSHERIQMAAKPDGTSDNQCECDTGYQYSASGELCLEAYLPITPASQDNPISTTTGPSLTSSGIPTLETPSVSTNETSGNTTEIHVPSTIHPTHLLPPHQVAMNALTWILVIVLLTTVLICIILCLCYLKRWCCCKHRKNEREVEGNRREENLMLMQPGNSVDPDAQRDVQGCGSATIASRRGSAAPEENQCNGSSSESAVGEDEPHLNEREVEGNRREENLLLMQPGNSVDPDTQRDVQGCGSAMIASRRGSAAPEENQCNGSSSESAVGEDEPHLNGTSRIGMADEDKEILRCHMTYFVNDLPVSESLDRMPGVFSQEDVAEITNAALDECKQRRAFINKLMTKGPQAFDKFVTVLDDVCDHLAKALRQAKEQN